MTNFLFGWIFGAITGGTVGALLVREVDHRFFRPYRWSCPERGCRFQVGGNDPGQVAGWANQHQHQGGHA